MSERELLKKRNILVVEDVPSMRDLMRGFLRQLGATTMYDAANGQIALQVLSQHHIDLIICDWEMPIMSGISLLKELQAHEKTKNIPFLMVTGRASGKYVQEFLTTGGKYFMVKPFNYLALAQKITSLITPLKQKKATLR